MAKQVQQQTKPNPPKHVKRDPVASGERDAAQNRVAAHNYFLSDKLECGMMLHGTEVKAIRQGKAQLRDAFALVKDGELWLMNAHIGAYDAGSYNNHATTRTRKLLVSADQLKKLIGKTQQKGTTLIPTKIYFKNGRAKCEIALAKGKQLWDKRETEKRKTADREAREAIVRSRKS